MLKGHVAVTQWFDGTNTYHTVRLHTLTDGYENVELLASCVYGYGNAWETTAREALGLPGIVERAGTLAQLGYTSSVIAVTRKKDM